MQKDNLQYQKEYKDFRKARLKNLQKAMDMFLKKSGIKNGLLLEIGSGTGFFYNHLPDKYKGLKKNWIQLDFYEDDIVAARKNSPDGKYILGVVHSLPFPDKIFDTVCGFASFDAIPNIHEVMNEVTRVLKPGGNFFNLSDHMPSLDQLAIELDKKGYTVFQTFEYDRTGPKTIKRTSDIVVFPRHDELPESAWSEIQKAYVDALAGCDVVETSTSYGESSKFVIITEQNNPLDKIGEVRKKYEITINPYNYFYKTIKQELEPSYTNIETGTIITGFGTDLLRYELTRPIFGLLSRLHDTNLALVRYVAAKKKS